MLVLCLSFAVAILDQATKYLVRSHLRVGERIPVIPSVFDLSYVRNTGAAWGLMAGLNDWLVVLSVVMLVVIIVFRRTFIVDAVLQRVAMGLMIGGIAGNLIDRLRLSYVVDFLDFYWGTHHFPAFNVADASICTGVGLYALSQFLMARAERSGALPAGQPTD